MPKQILSTSNAPAAIGTYSQGVRVGDTVYLSGQIGLNPENLELREGIDAQIDQVFLNLSAVANAADIALDATVKLNVYLTELVHFAKVNEIMAKYFDPPYPARAMVGVKELPRGALVEIDAVLHASPDRKA